MKRLIKKSEQMTILQAPQIGEDIKVSDDPNYKDKDMNELSKVENRDGAVLVDMLNKKVYVGYNGETHAQLIEQHYEIPEKSEEIHLDIDNYVVPGVYLKSFFGQESILLYDYKDEAEDVIANELPGVAVYLENWDMDDTLMRVSKKN